MASPAQGIYKQTTFKKQSALGTPAVGAGGQILRRKTSIFTATRDTTMNDEIVSHRMDTGITYGQKKTSGKLDGNLSPGTYSQLVAGALMKDFAIVTPFVAAVSTITSAATAPQFVHSTAGFLAAGLKVNDVLRITGFTTTATANNSRNFLITALTAGNMTGIFLDATVVAIKAPETGAVTFTVTGKKSVTPITAQTNDFFTFEEWYSDKAKSEVFPDCKVNQIQIGFPAAGPGTISIDVQGLGVRTLTGVQSFTSPAAETSTGVVQAVVGAIYLNALLTAHVTTFSMTIDRGITPMGASIGSAVAPDFNQGRLKISGSFTGMFDDTVLMALFDAQTTIALGVVCAVDTTATSDFVGVSISRIKITSDAPDDGEKGISRTYAWTGEYNGAGGAALAQDQTIISFQDSAAV